RVPLDQAGRDDAAERVAPGDGPGGGAEDLTEGVQGGDLVGQRLLDRPAGGRVGGTGQGVAVVEHPAAGDRVADVLGWVGTAGNHVSVAVEEQGAVPGAG